jgi:hypothetical protein
MFALVRLRTTLPGRSGLAPGERATSSTKMFMDPSDRTHQRPPEALPFKRSAAALEPAIA